MKNQLIPLEKNSFLNKIKNIFRRILWKRTKESLIVNESKEKVARNNDDFNNNLKIDIDNSNIYNNIEKENFIKVIEEDDSILDKLSLDRLKLLEKYYEEKVEQRENILKMLEEANAN